MSYSEVVPYTSTWQDVEAMNPKGVILSGGPASVYDEGAPLAPGWVYEKGTPVLESATECRCWPIS